MFEKIGRVALTLIATFAIWFSVGMIDLITGDHLIRNFAAILAFIFMLIAWLMLISTDNSATAYPYATPRETDQPTKAKRNTPEPAARDPRLALLIELMDEDERRDLKARLVNDLSADGEISLADLLAAQEEDAAALGKQ